MLKTHRFLRAEVSDLSFDSLGCRAESWGCELGRAQVLKGLGFRV